MVSDLYITQLFQTYNSMGNIPISKLDRTGRLVPYIIQNWSMLGTLYHSSENVFISVTFSCLYKIRFEQTDKQFRVSSSLKKKYQLVSEGILIVNDYPSNYDTLGVGYHILLISFTGCWADIYQHTCDIMECWFWKSYRFPSPQFPFIMFHLSINSFNEFHWIFYPKKQWFWKFFLFFSQDTNMGLVKQTITSLYKKNIQRLTKVSYNQFCFCMKLYLYILLNIIYKVSATAPVDRC